VEAVPKIEPVESVVELLVSKAAYLRRVGCFCSCTLSTTYV